MRNYEDPLYKEVRMRVLKRDKRKCQMPGCKCRKKLQVHHIQMWSKASSLRYDELNMISLCKEHHDSIRGLEHLYVGLFLGIAQANSKKPKGK